MANTMKWKCSKCGTLQRSQVFQTVKCLECDERHAYIHDGKGNDGILPLRNQDRSRDE